MAKVAAAGPLAPSNTLKYGGCSKVTTATLKRKTPSELRGELLKQKNLMELVDESPSPEIGSTMNAEDVVHGQKKELPKIPRYVDTRMNELFPIRKNSVRLKLLSEKEIAKKSTRVEHSGCLKIPSVPSDLADESQQQVLRAEDSVTSTAFGKSRTVYTCNPSEKCAHGTFRSVTELSSGGENLSGLSNLDMDKALKGLVSHEPLTASETLAGPSKRICNLKTQSCLSDLNIPGRKTPLDLTLKTTMRVLSSSSVNWFHRSVNCSTSCHGLQHRSWTSFSWVQDMNSSTELASSTPEFSTRALYSWVYPQSRLHSSVISALTLAERGGQMDFLSNRHEAWENSFRSLYYMLRKKICNIFYVCTTQFVVMFTACDGLKEAKRTCSAYISQSTRGLRSLLKEHEVSFSMPLCHSKVEEVTAEDLVELSELGKHSSDQHFVPMSDTDNTPQSLLTFAGNESVHALYDFLLNYRYFLTSLTGMDVPMLYSPVPFENAALSAPEVRCKEVRRADHMHLQVKESNTAGEPGHGSSPGICYSVEIKDAYLPPWTISSICDAMGTDETSYEASFVTEPTSIGLNVGLDAICQDLNPKATMDDTFKKSNWLFGIPNITFFPHLRSAFLKHLKYSCGSYTASLSQV